MIHLMKIVEIIFYFVFLEYLHFLAFSFDQKEFVDLERPTYDLFLSIFMLSVPAEALW